MITRVVKLSIRPDKHDEFEVLFKNNNALIKKMPGCLDVKAYQSVESNYFFTISKWSSEEDLDHYRQSDLFGSIWPTVKTWMNDKPEAWSLNEIK